MNRRHLLRSALGLALAPVAARLVAMMPAPARVPPMAIVGETGPEFILPSAALFVAITNQLTTIERRRLERAWREAP